MVLCLHELCNSICTIYVNFYKYLKVLTKIQDHFKGRAVMESLNIHIPGSHVNITGCFIINIQIPHIFLVLGIELRALSLHARQVLYTF